eukprot:1152791-Pelagomonas_calceolata.AAC.9
MHAAHFVDMIKSGQMLCSCNELLKQLVNEQGCSLEQQPEHLLRASQSCPPSLYLQFRISTGPEHEDKGSQAAVLKNELQ